MITSVVPWRKVEDGIHGWFAEATCLNTVWANQDGPERRYPYAVLDIIAGPTPESFFQSKDKFTDENGCEYYCISGRQLFTVNAQVVAGGKAGNDPDQYAREYASIAIASLDISAYNRFFRDVAVTSHNVSNIIDLSEEVGTERVSRVSVDFDFAHRAQFCLPLDDFGYFNKVDVTTSLEDGKNILVEAATCQQVAQ